MKGSRSITALRIDPAFIVLDKPAGVLTAHAQEGEEPALVERARAEYGDLYVVHRLDRDASGAVVFARTREAHRELNLQFDSRTVTKRYRCLLEGNPAWQEATAEAPLRADGDRRHRTRVDEQTGKPSETAFLVVERFGRHTYAEATIGSGRRHQVRAHAAALGFPVACDALYGPGAPVLLSAYKRKYREPATGERALLDRLALHAAHLEFDNPGTGERVLIDSPLPRDFEVALKQLRRWARR